MNWQNSDKKALHWNYNPENDVLSCNLCPNRCKLRENQTGICGVRKRVNNELYALNYGYCICPVIETIETEAVFHFQPGAPILSMGNIGCNMKCSFCQNWETSQVKHLDNKQVRYMSPQETIDLAIANQIKIISWTYNDPVVWHEYVLETSRLARENGILTLYKSALNMEPEPIAELIECIDIFSISLKAMDEEIYRKIMKGSLQSVLNGIKQIYSSGKHLELSQLVVTKLNDTAEHAARTAEWILQHLDENIPLHFVSYHPAYKYTEERTPFEVIEMMCNTARNLGIKHCYAGNIFGEDMSNTYCLKCNHLLVQRTGLSVFQTGLDEDGNCLSCGHKSPIHNHSDAEFQSVEAYDFIALQVMEGEWGEHSSYHLVLHEGYSGSIDVMVLRQPSQEKEYFRMRSGLGRLLISRKDTDEQKIIVSLNSAIPAELIPLLDRAHFPTI
jgi:pyruvate formate lyase activating enzyme